jgi:hypothetical protein
VLTLDLLELEVECTLNFTPRESCLKSSTCLKIFITSWPAIQKNLKGVLFRRRKIMPYGKVGKQSYQVHQDEIVIDEHMIFLKLNVTLKHA